jgi:hypothetical protein
VLDHLALEIIDGTIHDGDRVLVEAENGKIEITPVRSGNPEKSAEAEPVSAS